MTNTTTGQSDQQNETAKQTTVVRRRRFIPRTIPPGSDPLLTTLLRQLDNAKMSDGDLAERAGYPVQTVYKIVSGETRYPSIYTMRDLLNAAGLDLYVAPISK